MHEPAYTLNTLFAQMGLNDSDEAIDSFVRNHAPIPKEIPIYEATFWTSSQSALLKESLKSDSDWAEVVDQLDVQLRN